MNHEFKKVGKIIDELTTFLLKNGVCDIDIKINYEKSQVKIIFKFKGCRKRQKDLLIETLTQERDFCMEEYGWELMGENDASGELNLLGMCLDDVVFEEEGDLLTVMLVRNH